MREALVDFKTALDHETGRIEVTPKVRIKKLNELKNVVCFTGTSSQSSLELMQ